LSILAILDKAPDGLRVVEIATAVAVGRGHFRPDRFLVRGCNDVRIA
jgi:hypothetical protein